MDQNNLTRRERRKLERQEKKENQGAKLLLSAGFKKRAFWLIIVIIVVGSFYWLFRESTKPLPGEAVEDKGREHVTDIAGVEYSSNPPTSGPHFTVWAKPGVYDRLISDGHLIHSLEHGYIVIWYDCNMSLTSNRWSLIKTVSAHDEPGHDSPDSGQLLKHLKVKVEGDMSWFTPENPPDVEIPLPEVFDSNECKSLVNDLSGFTNVSKRVIVAPRLNMDAPIVLTAWGRIMKLTSVDDAKIKEFIRAFHNKGPERTNE